MKILIILLIGFVKLELCPGSNEWTYCTTSSSEFRTVANIPTYVDKTMMIKTLFSTVHANVLITGPRRSGKSTNLNMIKTFCEIVVDRNGTGIGTNETENYRIFSANQIPYFTNSHASDIFTKNVLNREYLNVYKDKDFFNAHFGQYPVIDLNFVKLDGNNYELFIYGIREIVWDAYRSHEYLKFSEELDEEEKSEFNKCIQNPDRLEDYQLEDSIQILSRLLHVHFNKKVIVLIDEYDAPIQKAIFYYKGKEIGKIIYYLKKLISNLLNSNIHIERALLIGCLKPSSATTDANIVHFQFGRKHPFSSYCGFTLEEVTGLAKQFNMSEKMAAIQSWDDGYRYNYRYIWLAAILNS